MYIEMGPYGRSNLFSSRLHTFMTELRRLWHNEEKKEIWSLLRQEPLCKHEIKKKIENTKTQPKTSIIVDGQ